jgi:hypothetical protein
MDTKNPDSRLMDYRGGFSGGWLKADGHGATTKRDLTRPFFDDVEAILLEAGTRVRYVLRSAPDVELADKRFDGLGCACLVIVGDVILNEVGTGA